MTKIFETAVEIWAPYEEKELGGLFAALREDGLNIRESGALCLVVARDAMEPGLVNVMERAIAGRRNWLLIAAVGELASVGPIFGPGHSPCYRCLADRLRLNGVERASPLSDVQRNTAFRVASAEASTWLRTGHARTEKQWLSIGPDGARQRHPLIAFCDDCKAAAKRVRLTASGLESAASGIVTGCRLEEITPGLFRASADCSQTWIPDHDRRYLCEPRQAVDGKGATPAAAMRSCLGEAVERYSLLCQGSESRRGASYQAVAGRAIHPDSLTLTSPRQRSRAAWWRRHHGSFHWPDEPFDELCEIDWVGSIDAASGEIVLVPAEYCLLGFGARFAHAHSNGCAAGSTKWHAARSALLELIERDSVAIWWYNRLERPRVDWRAVDNGGRIAGIARRLSRQGRRFWMLDLTADLNIPVYVAISCDADDAHIALGSGASLNPEIAAWKAMAEMTAHTRDFTTRRGTAPADGNLRAWWSWWHASRLAEHPYLIPSGQVRPSASLPSRDGYGAVCGTSEIALASRHGAKSEFLTCVRQVEMAGMRVLLYDHTRPELKVPVIRALVPGLRHFWARFAPGRLYDVPVKLGWRTALTVEKDLNPIPYFL